MFVLGWLFAEFMRTALRVRAILRDRSIAREGDAAERTFGASHCVDCAIIRGAARNGVKLTRRAHTCPEGNWPPGGAHR